MIWCRKCFSFLTLQLWLKLHQSNSLLNETYFYSYQVLIFYRFYSAIDSYHKRFTPRYLQIQDRLQFKTRWFKTTKNISGDSYHEINRPYILAYINNSLFPHMNCMVLGMPIPKHMVLHLPSNHNPE